MQTERPAEIRELAKVVYDHTSGAKLLAAVESLGFHRVKVNGSSGAWTVRKGDLHAVIAFGGPWQVARLFDWIRGKNPVGWT